MATAFSRPRRRLLILFSLSGFTLLTSPARAAGLDYTVIGTLPFAGIDPNNSNPYGLVLHPTLQLGYVTLAGLPDFAAPALFNGRSVVEFDCNTLAVTRVFETELYPVELAISPDGADLYVINSTSASLSHIALASGVVTSVPLVDSLGVAVAYPSGVSLSADGTQLYVTSNGSSFDGSAENLLVLDRATLSLVDAVEIVGGLGRFAVRSDGRVVLPVGYPDDIFPSQPQLRVYDAVNGWQLLANVELTVDITDFPAPIDVVLSPDGSRAYVSVYGGSSEIFVFDVDNLLLLPSLMLPLVDFYQHGLGLGDDGATLFVTDFFAAQTRVISLTTGDVIVTIPSPGGPNSVRLGAGRAWITDQAGVTLTAVRLPGSFVRGDFNGDTEIDLGDAIAILSYLFSAGPGSCLDAGDANDNGALDVADAVTLLNYLFAAGSAPLTPFPLAGADVSVDGLACP
ncbi:MAG: dockerin type I domain-containing protein [Planctomycetota bacterium]